MYILIFCILLILLFSSIVAELLVITFISQILMPSANLGDISKNFSDIPFNMNILFNSDALGIATLIILAALLKLALSVTSSYFTFYASINLAKTYLEKYLYNYYGHVSRFSTSSIINNLINRIQILTNSTFHAVLNILMSLISLICITYYIIMSQNISIPVLEIIFATVSGIIIFGLIIYYSKKLSTDISFFTENSVAVILSIIENLQLVYVHHLQKLFSKDFIINYKKLRAAQSLLLVFASTPKILLELILYLSILLFAVGNVFQGSDGFSEGNILLLVGLIRLLPYIATIFSSIVMIGGAQKDVRELFKFRNSLITGQPNNLMPKFSSPLHSQDLLMRLSKISYSYVDNVNVLLDVSLDIRAHEILGVRGKSGSGKTTLINIICGLLRPTSGDLLISQKLRDLSSIETNTLSVALVQQRVMLIPNTLRWNVKLANGVNETDDNKILEILQRLGFRKELEEGLSLDTQIGDGGKQLSGGQVQRLGLARALYAEKKLIVLDEFTSALDVHTELQCLDIIKTLRDYASVIIISHRQAPFDICDTVFELKGN